MFTLGCAPTWRVVTVVMQNSQVGENRELPCHRDKLEGKFDIIHLLFFYIIKLKNKNCCKLRDIDQIETNCTSNNYLLEQFYLYQHGQIKTRVKD